MDDEVIFMSKRFKRVSLEAKDLIRKMLEKSPLLRITPTDCLKHPFFKRIRDEQASQVA